MNTKSVSAFACLAFFVLAGATATIPTLHAQDGHKGHNHKAGAHNDKHDHANEDATSHKDHHPKPEHGGVVLEIGEHHGELVLSDGKIQLFLSNHDGKHIAPKGYRAVAMVLSGKERQGPLELQSVEDNFLQSAAPVSQVKGARVVITLTDPHGHSSQARYQMP